VNGINTPNDVTLSVTIERQLILLRPHHVIRIRYYGVLSRQV